jgi:hypothetical protein
MQEVKLKHLLTSLIFFSLSCLAANAQEQGYLFGTVTTIEDREYTGIIRWGKEEVFWSDHFNASKVENENLNFLSQDELDYLEASGESRTSMNSFFGINWYSESSSSFLHQLVIEFGNIATIRTTSSNKALIFLKNGRVIEVNGSGYNDIGTTVSVFDEEIGKIDVKWDRIDKITFSDMPKKMKNLPGAPLYGKVTTRKGTFEGYIQWDHDERLDTDKLDGDTDDGDLSIPFSEIVRIERRGKNASFLELQGGRTFLLSNSNDVNEGNRGIIVTVRDLGRVDIPWSEFMDVEFTKTEWPMKSYAEYNQTSSLNASVTTTSQNVHKGEMVYDLDEAYEFEILHGVKDKIEYLIPFYQLKNIAPTDRYGSSITLKNGATLNLEISQDVSEKNQGIILKNKSEQLFIPWDKVLNINLF